MKRILFAFFACTLLFSASVNAQIDSLIVEKYYISDANDATDTTAEDMAGNGALPIGSVTYRIYIDLSDSCRLKKIYGDANHVLKFSSDSVFFNHKTEGKSYGNSIIKTRLEDSPTVALDSWITLDHATKHNSGVLKTEDPDTSILGGLKSGPHHPGGFLNNNDPGAGIPLDSLDGLVSASTISLSGGGDLNFVGIPDSTIFGNLVSDSFFISNDAFLQNSAGIKGPTSANRVLVAQLTTRGEIAFELNLIVERPNGLLSPTTYTLVAQNNLPGEMLSPYLTYPPACGCTDKKYLEYNPLFSCLVSDSCQTLKVFGCTDPLACNYDPAANIDLSNYCCYPGFCQDRDLSLACPALSNTRLGLFPNPATDHISLDISANDSEVKYAVYDVFGRLVAEKNIGFVSGSVTEYVNISNFENGVYMIRVYIGDIFILKTFFKN